MCNSVPSLSSSANFLAYPTDKKATTISARKVNEFESVTFIIYSTDQRKIQRAKNRIKKMVADNITPIISTHSGFSKLSKKEKADIESRARASDVSVKFKEDGAITIVGYHEDTSLVMHYCHEVLLEKIEEGTSVSKIICCYHIVPNLC